MVSCKSLIYKGLGVKALDYTKARPAVAMGSCKHVDDKGLKGLHCVEFKLFHACISSWLEESSWLFPGRMCSRGAAVARVRCGSCSTTASSPRTSGSQVELHKYMFEASGICSLRSAPSTDSPGGVRLGRLRPGPVPGAARESTPQSARRVRPHR